MSVMNRKMFSNRDARTKLAGMGGILSSSPELMGATQRFETGGGATPRGVPDSLRLSESLVPRSPVAIIGSRNFYLSEDGNYIVDEKGNLVRDPAIINAVLSRPGIAEALNSASARLEPSDPFVASAAPADISIPSETLPMNTAADSGFEGEIFDSALMSDTQFLPPQPEAEADRLAASAGFVGEDEPTTTDYSTITEPDLEKLLSLNPRNPNPALIDEILMRSTPVNDDEQLFLAPEPEADGFVPRFLGDTRQQQAQVAKDNPPSVETDGGPAVETDGGPTFFGDVVPYAGGLGSLLAQRVGSEVKDIASEVIDNNFAGAGPFVRDDTTLASGELLDAQAQAQAEAQAEAEAVPELTGESLLYEDETGEVGRAISDTPLYKTPAGPEDPIKRDSKGVPTSVNKNRISDEKLQRFTDAFAKSDRGPRATEIYENQLAEYEAAVIQNNARQVYEDGINAEKAAAAAVENAAEVTGYDAAIEAARRNDNPVLVTALQEEQLKAGADLSEIDADADGSLGTDFTSNASKIDELNKNAVSKPIDQVVTELGLSTTAPVGVNETPRMSDVIKDLEKKVADADPADANQTTASAILDASNVDTSNMDIKQRTVAMREMLNGMIGETDADKKEEFWMNMAMMGFAVASGESSSALKNIGDGLLAGTAQIQKGKTASRDRDDKITLLAFESAIADKRAADALSISRDTEKRKAAASLKAYEQKLILQNLYEKPDSILKTDLGLAAMYAQMKGVEIATLGEGQTPMNIIEELYKNQPELLEKFSRVTGFPLSGTPTRTLDSLDLP